MFNVDYCLCTGIGCSLRDNCRRYQWYLKDIEDEKKTGDVNYNTYFTDPPYNKETKTCDYEF